MLQKLNKYMVNSIHVPTRGWISNHFFLTRVKYQYIRHYVYTLGFGLNSIQFTFVFKKTLEILEVTPFTYRQNQKSSNLPYLCLLLLIGFQMTNTANYYLVNFRVYKLRTLNHVLIMDHFYAEHVKTCHSSVVKRPSLRVNIFLRTVDLKNTNI